MRIRSPGMSGLLKYFNRARYQNFLEILVENLKVNDERVSCMVLMQMLTPFKIRRFDGCRVSCRSFGGKSTGENSSYQSSRNRNCQKTGVQKRFARFKFYSIWADTQIKLKQGPDM